MVRHRLLAALFAGALIGCPPPTTNTPGSAPSVAPVSTQAYFVRLTSLTIGGDFDGAGREEVEVILRANEETRRLFGRSELDLPDDALRTFELSGGRLIEIPAFPRLALGLDVYDVDVTGSEIICGGSVEVALEAYGEEAAPNRVVADLGTIRGISDGLLQGRKSFTIPGATCALALVRVPRRDAPDDASRALVSELFAVPLAARAPATGSEAETLQETLEQALRRAEAGAEASTHTYARAAIPRLKDSASDLLRALDQASGPTVEALRESVSALRDALTRISPAERAGREKLFDDVQALVDAGPPALAEPALQGASARVSAARAALEAPAASEPAGETHLELVLGAYGSRLEGARAALAALPTIEPLLTVYQETIRREAN